MKRTQMAQLGNVMELIFVVVVDLVDVNGGESG